MAHKEACQVYIEQQIKEGLETGKTPYSIGKELSSWVEKLFETSIPARTLEQKARRIENATNVASPPTPCNPSEIPDNQVTHGGKREGAGAPQKYEKPPEPWSCAMQMAGLAIGQLGRIPNDDPKRQEAFEKVIAWIDNQS